LRTALVLAALVFIATLLVRLPAGVLVSHLPAGIACEEVSGTVWNGTCAQLSGDGLKVAGVSWHLHPLALLGLTLSVDLSSIDPAAGGSGSVVLTRSGDASITELHATLPLPPGAALLPAGASATLVLSLPSVTLHADHLTSIEGSIQAQHVHVSNPAADIGSYELQLQPPVSDSPIEGQLHDLDGPLQVNGQLRLQPSGEYEVNGTVTARANASEDLDKLLQYLGPADAQGARTFSLAGSL
jgi:hypothetical protein